jgi:hypothetical protein
LFGSNFARILLVIRYIDRVLEYSMARLFHQTAKCIAIGLLAAAGLGGSCNDDPPPGPGDTTPPEVESVSPANSSVDVPLDIELRVVFTEPIDEPSIAGSVFLTAGATSASVTTVFVADTLFITPVAGLDYLTQYQVRLTTDIRDQAGNALASEYTWTFTTEPDPITLPPTVTSTSPVNGASDVAVGTAITAVFSKGMDSASVTAAFTLSGTSGTATYDIATRTATFTPDLLLEFDVLYQAQIAAAATDTFGIQMGQDFTWQFITQADPFVPVLEMDYPPDSAIIGDTVTLSALVSHPVGADSVVFFQGPSRIGEAVQSGPLWETVWDASSLTIAQAYGVFARAYYDDGSEIKTGISDTIGIVFQWLSLTSDADDLWRVDIARVLTRTSDSLLWLRFEFHEPWNEYPYPVIDSIVNSVIYRSLDSALALAIYFDIDLNSETGRDHFDHRIPLNDIGAEYQLLIGLFGGDEALREHMAANDSFVVVYDTTGLAYHSVPPSSTVLEFALRWTDLQATTLALLAINAFVFSDGETTPLHDMIPDENEGSFVLRNDPRYVGGKPTVASAVMRNVSPGRPASTAGSPPNPFE